MNSINIVFVLAFALFARYIYTAALLYVIIIIMN